MKTLNNWAQSLKTVKLPRYKDLPEIPLYSDQVLEYVNETFSLVFTDAQGQLTSAMINNYVKQKMMPAPVKKRYSKDHLAYIITITVLKPVISIPNIVAGVHAVRSEHNKEEGFDIFITFLEEAIRCVVSETIEEQAYHSDTKSVSPLLVPIRAATMAFAGKLIAEKALGTIMKETKIHE